MDGTRPSGAAAESPLVLGHLDEPRDGASISGDLLTVRGWFLREQQLARRVETWVDGVLCGRARLGVVRPDLIGVQGRAAGLASGFEHRIPIEVEWGSSREVEVQVVAFDAESVPNPFPPVRVVLRRRGRVDSDEATRARGLDRSRRILAPRWTVDGFGKDLVVFTHSLALGGGQLYLQELLRRLALDHGLRCWVVSATDGALRGQLEDLGVDVHISPLPPMSGVAEYESRVLEWATLAKASGAGVALVNTLGMFPAIDAVRRAGLPSIWAIHESFSIPDFCALNWGADGLPPMVRDVLAEALEDADSVVFEADATREMFAPLCAPGAARTIRYGIDIAEIEAFRQAHERSELRREAGIPADAVVLLCMGVFEPRKAQALLVDAFAEVSSVYPDVMLVLVGAHPSPYSDGVRLMVEEFGLGKSIRIVDIQPETYPWYALADVLVSASDVESLPRSAMESMAFGVPVLATDIFGLPELIVDGVNGWLMDANDRSSLVAGLVRCLVAGTAARQSIGSAARERMLASNDSTDYGTAYARLVQELGRRPLASAQTRSGATSNNSGSES